MTVATVIADIVKTAYTPSEQTDAITSAETLLNGLTSQTITSNVDTSWDTAIISLAIRLLQFGPKLEDEALNADNIQLTNLITKDMRAAVREVIHDETDSFIFRNATPTRRR